MSMKKYSEQDGKLDDEFNELLDRIKGLLNNKCVFNKKLCESWLEKFKTVKNQRVLRNKYANELYRSIKAGNFNGVIKEFPPKSDLLSFNYSDEVKFDSLSSVIETSSSESDKNVKQIKYTKDKVYIDRHKSDSSVLDERCRASSYKIQLDTCKKRVQFLADVVNELHEQNGRLRLKLKGKGEGFDSEKQKNEIEELKLRLEKVEFDKKELEKNHRDIVEQYKNTLLEQIDKFKSCLQTEQDKNVELVDRVAILSQQVETLKLEKENKVKFVEKKFSDELEANKCHYEGLLKEKEQELRVQERIVGQLKEEITSVTSKLQDIENKLQIKLEDGNKLQDLITDQYSVIREEFDKIRDEMQLAGQHHHHYLEDKVSKLKKNLLKVEISKHKLSSEFKRKIFEVLKTKELEITTLQMQIESQKSLTNSVGSEKQSEIYNNIVNQIEDRYKDAWASSEALVDNQKQLFLQKIIGLESQIHDIKNELLEKEFYV